MFPDCPLLSYRFLHRVNQMSDSGSLIGLSHIPTCHSNVQLSLVKSVCRSEKSGKWPEHDWLRLPMWRCQLSTSGYTKNFQAAYIFKYLAHAIFSSMNWVSSSVQRWVVDLVEDVSFDFPATTRLFITSSAPPEILEHAKNTQSDPDTMAEYACR